ncbi:hypothetical protein AR457_26130 [Streptomyces agglomeratus]|uniref:Gram-positive cocci surface proteins LPxTG domain-containing protein n=1 Tax=Streptomyces agglomeratus TaxID=285458 RepID=A0A1E5PD05_9ACTN|nr:hypothetical protein [Streptomyces agglomeratus]OEJ27418.1 hypothetical protein AS594_26005 [Streptomyces agglomeratus]OEJ38526.1 hypothetical protein BGK70_10525 [Streptomyces agglomeratus]OEJ47090.1 hypothetical protein AR457_26130 [Streptomyces agglomeratus]OEJ51054.1 hypothetical protein BGK72_10010 [Streptomyces agglomeratus]OEJ58424.1 hypothetical protein BGM19_10920 [Streptomyces agglomeratus]
MTAAHVTRAAVAAAAATLLLGLAPLARADVNPVPPAPAAPSAEHLAAAHKAAAAPAVRATLARFFAREAAVTEAAAAPRVGDATVPVHTLAPDFVAGREGAPVAELEYLAGTAVSADGQKASLWTVPGNGPDGSWQVVNIATGDDEARFAAKGARTLPGGTVFREPQIDAWYVQRHARVLPLDEDAVRAVGAGGTTLAAYRDRVRKAYGDKLPGSAYAKKGGAGGYGAPAPAATGSGAAASSAEPSPVAPVAAGAGGLAALALAATALRMRRRTAPGG